MNELVRPPRLAVSLLTRRLSDDWREFIVGDLEEEFATRSRGSAWAARAWFWGQALRSGLAAAHPRGRGLVDRVCQYRDAPVRKGDRPRP